MSSPIPDFFTLFDLPPRFAIDTERLGRSYREVLAQVHPDRFVGAGQAERRVAMQLSSHANEGYRVLRSESARASYLLGLHGVMIEEGAGQLPAAFLEQQMAWREALEDARAGGDSAAVAALAREVAAERAGLIARLASSIDEHGDFQGASALVRALMFLEKIASEIDACAGAGHDTGSGAPGA